MQLVFFFGDIVRILIEGGYIVIEDLYTELGITDEAREKLLSLPDNILKSALEIYSRGKKMKLQNINNVKLESMFIRMNINI